MRRRLAAILFLSVSLVSFRGAAAVTREFPFEFREGLLWVEVTTADSPRPLHFLLDTGAEVGVINLSTVKRLGLSLGQPVSVRSVETSTTGYWPEKLSLNAGAVALPSDCLALDLSRLNRACSRSVDGLIGADFFRNRIVQIDFEAGKIRLLTADEIRSGARAITMESRRSGLCVMARIDGLGAQRFRVDTGCATALQWVTTSVSVKRDAGKLAIGLSELNIPQARTSVDLGIETFRDVPTGLHSEAIFDGESGLVGNGLLSRFKSVTLDGISSRLIFSDLRSSD